jgi:phosphate transport system protein
MRATFHRELATLQARLVSVGQVVQAQLDDALAALATGDADAADAVVRRDQQVNAQSAEVERGLLCTLARQAPVAGDLRLVAGLLHVNAHLERMGDLCANVARSVPAVTEHPPPAEVRATLVEMGARAAEVVAAALACFADLDAAAAERLPTLDQAVDRLNDRVFTLVAHGSGGGALAWVPQVVLLARFLERLGDQAVDVGEQTRFVATGEVRELLPSKAARIPTGGR